MVNLDKGFKVGKLNNILYIQVMKDHGLLVEKYRPTNIDNYVGNESIKKSISNYISQNDIQNLIFFLQMEEIETIKALLKRYSVRIIISKLL